jgi:leucine dehydrogenase
VAEAVEDGVQPVPPTAVTTTPCDVWLPCALGHGVDVDVAGRVPCRAICGSANNQLADPRAADILQARNILHAPDVVVSAGAVIEGVLTVLEPGPDVQARVTEAINRIETTVAEVLAFSGPNRSPSRVAAHMARELMAVRA